MKGSVNKPSGSNKKKGFVQELGRMLVKAGFTGSGPWILEQKQPGRLFTMNVNGRLQKMQEEPVTVTKKVELFGTGSIKDRSTGKVQDLYQVVFQFQNGTSTLLEYEEAFYSEDLKALGAFLHFVQEVKLQ